MSAEDVRSPVSPDPTQSISIRKPWASRWNALWRQVRGEIRRALVDEDRFDLAVRGQRSRLSTYRDDAARLQAFRQWLRQTITGTILEEATSREVRSGQHWTASWVHQAYEHGLRRADEFLRMADYEPPETRPAAAITAKRHRRRIRRGFVRTYQDTQDVVDDVVTRVSRTFDEHLSQETINRQELASAANEDVDAEGQTRTETIAHSLTVLLINRAALERYRTAGVERVGAAIETDGGEEIRQPSQLRVDVRGPMTDDPELATTGVQGSDEQVAWAAVLDQQTCQQCIELNGTTWKISDYTRGEAPMPVDDTHPRCRCILLPL